MLLNILPRTAATMGKDPAPTYQWSPGGKIQITFYYWHSVFLAATIFKNSYFLDRGQQADIVQ